MAVCVQLGEGPKVESYSCVTSREMRMISHLPVEQWMRDQSNYPTKVHLGNNCIRLIEHGCRVA